MNNRLSILMQLQLKLLNDFMSFTSCSPVVAVKTTTELFNDFMSFSRFPIVYPELFNDFKSFSHHLLRRQIALQLKLLRIILTTFCEVITT